MEIGPKVTKLQADRKWLRVLPENKELLTLAVGKSQVRRGTTPYQCASQATLNRWLKRHRPTHRCRVQRLTPGTFAIWIEPRTLQETSR